MTRERPVVNALRHPVAVGGGLRLVLRVDIDGANQPFLPERLLVGHDAGELSQPQTRDFHDLPLVDRTSRKPSAWADLAPGDGNGAPVRCP